MSILKFELGHGIQTLYGLQGVVDKAIFSADGRLIAAASHEWHVGVWERQSGRLLGVLPAPAGRFADSIGMAFDPSGRRFACSVGHEARLWDIQERRMIARWGLPEGLCDSVAFSDDDHLILVRQETKSREGGRFNAFPPEKFPRVVRLYDLLSAKPTHPLTEIDAFDRDVRSIQMAPNGSLFAVDGVGTDQGRGRRRFHVYEGPTGRILRGLPTSPGRNDSFWFFFDADAKILAVPLGEAAEAITLFGLPNLDYRGVTRAPMACLSPGARWSMNTTLDQPPTLALYDLATGQPLMQLAQDIVARQLSLNFSPDGRHAIFGRKDGTVSVLDLVEVNQRLTGLHLGWRVAPQVTP